LDEETTSVPVLIGCPAFETMGGSGKQRAKAGDAALAAAWAEGRAITLEQAIEYALADQSGDITTP
jgi:hypothetical protein